MKKPREPQTPPRSTIRPLTDDGLATVSGGALNCYLKLKSAKSGDIKG